MNAPPLRRLTILAAFLHIAVVVIAVSWIGSEYRAQALTNVETELLHSAESLAASPRIADPIEMVRNWSTPSIRLTLHDERGVAIGDSQAPLLSGTLSSERSEVREALAGRIGRARRPTSADAAGSTSIAVPVPDPSRTDDAAALSTGSVKVVRLVAATDAIERHTSAIRWRVGIATAAAGLLGLLLLRRAAEAALDPLPRLVDFARELARGDLDTTLDLETRQAAWTSLGDAFDRMQSRLQSREEVLRDYGQRLETTLANMAEGVIAVGRNGQVAFANAAALKLLAVPQSIPEGRSLHDLVRYPQLLEAHERSMEMGQSVKLEFETFGDSRRTLSLRIDPIPGEPTSEAVIVIRDVTELRQLETMRRDFVANVSHELKTPLSAIKAYAETLRLGAIDDVENRLRFVGEIEQQAERLYRLILDLIQLARIESERAMIVREPLDLAEIMDEAIGPFHGVARSRQLALEVHYEGEPRVLADAESLITILDNLISNAVRYTSPGGRIDVRCGGTSDVSWVEVEDTGIGIPGEHQARVFERFYRVDRARSRDVGGTGLGLSIVKHLVQALEGRIELFSRVGVGTRIRIELPVPAPNPPRS